MSTSAASRPGRRTVGGGAGFAGDRVDPAVRMAESGQVTDVVLECLAERTMVAGLVARRTDPKAGYDRRLTRRLSPLLPAVLGRGMRIITNLGSANPGAGAERIAALCGELGLSGIKVAAVIGDDIAGQRDQVAWDAGSQDDAAGEWLGAHLYLGAGAMIEALDAGAHIVVTGRVADSALFVAPVAATLDDDLDAWAGATTVGHLLECSAQITGGNLESPGVAPLTAQDMADIGYPVARVEADGSAEISVQDGCPGRLDEMACALQLLYEVHDPSRYLTPDATVDFTGVTVTQTGPRSVRVAGARHRGLPPSLKAIGFLQQPGLIIDMEIGYAGLGALDRAAAAADVLRLRLDRLGVADANVDVVGVNSILGPVTAAGTPAEARAHVSARCTSADMADVVEDEVYALTLCGPAGGAGMRTERRPRVEVRTGLAPRELARTSVEMSVSR